MNMRKLKSAFYRLISVTLFLAVMLVLTSCGSSESGIPLQLNEGSGQHVARIYIKDYGSFDLRLFENEAKDTVESFIELANSGFYEGLPVYSLIEDFCVLLGDAGSQNQSQDDKSAFKNSGNGLYPFAGSLCVINDGNGTGAEHFMIVTADSGFLYEMKDLLAYKMITPQEYFETAYGKTIDDETMGLFYKYGGAPWLMGDCLVFGQIYDGMDVVYRLFDAEVSEDASYASLEDIIIDHIEVK